MADAPTPRLADELAGPSVWHTLEHLREVGSTNDVVAERLEEGRPAGLVVVADRQTAGRGRLDRRWADHGEHHPESSLLVSMLAAAPAEHVGLAPLAVGLAVLDALRPHVPGARLKWPNDLVVPTVGGLEKAGGMLVQHHDADRDRPARLVVGVGINVDWRGLDRDGTEGGWTSLAEAVGRGVDRWELLADLLVALPDRLARVAEDPEEVRAAYVQRCATLGETVRASLGEQAHTGRAVDIDGAGALVVETADGRVTIAAGDVVSVRPPA